MTTSRSTCGPCCSGIPRRAFLADVGMGFTGLVLGSMLHRDGFAQGRARSPGIRADGKPHFQPKAKSVIWLFMTGGVSQMESFDPKPALEKYKDKSITETPYQHVLDRKLIDSRVRNMTALGLALPPEDSRACRPAFASAAKAASR